MPGVSKDFEARLLTMKIELANAEGVDAAPTVTANAMTVLNMNLTFMDADAKVRNLDRPYFGGRPTGLTAFKRRLTFDMEMAGSPGANNTAPAWMTMMRIAGFATPTILASSVTQVPITSGIFSATLYPYFDDLLMPMLGARASVGFKIEDDEYPVFSFNALGVPPPALANQIAPGAPTYSGFRDPVLSTTENTTFLFDGYACPLRRWTMDANADLQFRSLINPADRVNYANRSWSGEIVMEVPSFGGKNYFTNIRPGATAVVQCIQGASAGNIVQIDCPAVQITGNVALSEEQGKIMATFPVTALPVSGNDEIMFTTK